MPGSTPTGVGVAAAGAAPVCLMVRTGVAVAIGADGVANVVLLRTLVLDCPDPPLVLGRGAADAHFIILKLCHAARMEGVRLS